MKQLTRTDRKKDDDDAHTRPVICTIGVKLNSVCDEGTNDCTRIQHTLSSDISGCDPERNNILYDHCLQYNCFWLENETKRNK